MKRLNRKKLIADFEQLREGFSQAVMRAYDNNDTTGILSFAAHYALANRNVVDLGGEGYNLIALEFYSVDNKQAPKALEDLVASIEKTNGTP